MSGHDDRRKTRRVDKYDTILGQLYLGLAVAALLGSVSVVLRLIVPNGKVAWGNVALGALAVVYLGAVLAVARRVLRTRYYDFRMALTGQSGAGKTVFSNLLYDHLMNGNDSAFEFTAESRSAIATYQAIRGMATNVWPAATTTGSVLQRDGTLRHRKVIVDLEIGDSAGEHWLNLVESEPSSRESDYLQWVLSARALVHVIPADRIMGEGVEVTLRSDVADLRLVAQLMRSVSRGRHTPVPILVVISKMDLLPTPLIDNEMMCVFPGRDAKRFVSTSKLTSAALVDVAELVDALSQELAKDFRTVDFTYSSAELARGLRSLGSARASNIPRWIVDSAVGQNPAPIARLLRSE